MLEGSNDASIRLLTVYFRLFGLSQKTVGRVDKVNATFVRVNATYLN